MTFGDKIKVLAPQSTGISSIAKQNAASETDIMISKYNNGDVSNADMKAFFQKQLTNQYVSVSDKTQIQTKLADFDVLIEKDRLEAVFKQAPENSIQKAQAATALKEFYTKRASTMVAGTPAHSQALENAGIWQQNIANIQESTNKLQRKNMQNQMLQQINQLPNSSSDKSVARAEMYKKLYEMAISQGDTDDAQVYLANMEQEATNAQAYSEQETATAQKTEMKQFIAEKELEISKLTDKSPEELKAKADLAMEIADRYGAMGDQYNATKYMTVATQAQEKYEKKLGSLSAKGAASLSAEQEKNYSDDIRLAQERYVNGLFDEDKFQSAEEEYKASLSKATQERKQSLESIYNVALNADGSEKISWKGKTRRVVDVIDEIEKEWNIVNGLEDAIASNAVMLKEVTTGETIGKNVPKYELIDIRNLNEQEQQLLAPDESGILHSGEMGKELIDPEEYKKLMLEDSYRKDLDYDSKTGKYYKYSGLQFNVYDPDTGQNYRQFANPQGKVASSYALKLAEQFPEEIKQIGWMPGNKIELNPEKAAQVNAQQTTMSAEEVRKSQDKAQKIKQVEQKAPIEQKSFIQQAQEKAQGILPTIQKMPIPTIADKVGQITKPALEAIEPAIEDVTQGIGEQLNKITPVVQQTAQGIIPIAKKVAQTVSSSSPAQYVAPKIAPVIKAVQSYNPIQTLQNNVQQAQKAVQSYNPVQTFQTNVQSAKNAVQNIGTTIKNTASNIWNKLKWW